MPNKLNTNIPMPNESITEKLNIKNWKIEQSTRP